MAAPLKVRFFSGSRMFELPATLLAAGSGAAAVYQATGDTAGVRLLMTGDRAYAVLLAPPVASEALSVLKALLSKRIWVVFDARSSVRRRLERVAGNIDGTAPAATVPATLPPAATVPPAATLPPAALEINLNEGVAGAAPLYLQSGGTLTTVPRSAQSGMDAADALIAAARWVSTRRTSTFERLFPPSAFHPDLPVRTERLSAAQAKGLADQIRGACGAAAVGGDAAASDPTRAAQVRSAGVTVLSHIVATVRRDPSFRATADAAAAQIFAVVAAEEGDPTARPALRAHAIQLLQRRAPALSRADADRATTLLRSLVRVAPPYAEMEGTWRIAMCSAYEFHPGECDILVRQHGFREIDAPADLDGAPFASSRYRVFEAPFRTPGGAAILLFARAASPSDENREMGSAAFTGVFINRHAQLGSYDMRAAMAPIQQVGYKLMMNSQCAGLTTRFAITAMFPDADIYSSWDSTYYRTGAGGMVSASEGLDCFVALLTGMSKAEPHTALGARIRSVQWSHALGRMPDFVQFVGPSHPRVISRYSDVNRDGKADFYDGFLDFQIRELAEDIRASATPRDPGVAASGIGGAAAKGLAWAAGSLNRVTQYSDLWQEMPGQSEDQYIFQAAGFYSHTEPPADIAAGKGPRVDPGLAPALCRYVTDDGNGAALAVDVLCHSWLSHSAGEYKRLMCAAEALWRAMDLGYLPKTGMRATPLGQRGSVLLTLAGLLDFPADANFIDGLWALALKELNFPAISRSVIRTCITDADHQASNYYGSVRGLRQLMGEAGKPGAVEAADPVAFEVLRSEDPLVGRARPLALE